MLHWVMFLPHCFVLHRGCCFFSHFIAFFLFDLKLAFSIESVECETAHFILSVGFYKKKYIHIFFNRIFLFYKFDIL